LINIIKLNQLAEMFFIIAEYVNKNFGNLFKLAAITPVNTHREDSYYVKRYGYSTQEELDTLV